MLYRRRVWRSRGFGAPRCPTPNPRVHRHDKYAARSRRRQPPSIGSNPASLPTRATSRYVQEEEEVVTVHSFIMIQHRTAGPQQAETGRAIRARKATEHRRGTRHQWCAGKIADRACDLAAHPCCRSWCSPPSPCAPRGSPRRNQTPLAAPRSAHAALHCSV